jgi:hypothetical protein
VEAAGVRPSPIGHQIGQLWYARSLVVDMPKSVLTLAAAWAQFDAMVFDGSVINASKTQARRVFYAGAQSILDILMASLEPENKATDGMLTAWRL